MIRVAFFLQNQQFSFIVKLMVVNNLQVAYFSRYP